tara:strand:- start:2631 stop:3701 length:1071 start_codon:yes stop_codon:yes gene_type:complete
MNISTDHKDENPFPNKPSGGYEWWYFDAISDDKEWSFVVIFYQGNPFSPKYIQEINESGGSPDNHPAVSISIYNRAQTEFYSFLEYTKHDFCWDEENQECKIGTNRFTKEMGGGNLIYKFHIDEELPSGHTISANFEFQSSIIDQDLINKKNVTEHHLWNLIQPKANVTGNINLKGKSGIQNIDFDGMGYHDHNVGLEPMKNDFKDWYWGRYHFEKATLIYYVMNRKNEKQYKAWLISDDNRRIIDQFDSIELEGSLTNLFGLTSSRKLVLKSDNTEITVQSALPIDNGPFYQRFLGQAIMKRDDQVAITEGFSEYIYPENIYKKRFWPAVKMRLRFKNQKPHWVQKFKRFYEWTW